MVKHFAASYQFILPLDASPNSNADEAYRAYILPLGLSASSTALFESAARLQVVMIAPAASATVASVVRMVPATLPVETVSAVTLFAAPLTRIVSPVLKIANPFAESLIVPGVVASNEMVAAA